MQQGLNSFQRNAVNAYKQSSVMSASPEKIVLMLFDGAIKFINNAVVFLKQNKLADFGENVFKAQRIFAELRKNLNFDRGEQIAINLDRLYGYVDQQLAKANIKKDEVFLNEALKIIVNLRAGWDEMIKTNTGPG